MSEKKIYDKKKEFSEWYVNAIENAQLLDQRYPVKGFPVYAPWGFRALRSMFRILEEMLETEDDNEPVLFPVVIPEDFLKKESEHVAGFEGEVFWVTHGGTTKLAKKLALRPTSETAMYPMFAYWIKSYTDLPLKIHQTVTVYRYETKHTRMLIRGREVFWNEGHSAHRTWEDAYNHVLKVSNIYGRFFKRFGIPYVMLKRPVWDKFPGADFTVALDTILPDGRVLQIGTVHHLGENFAKAFEIQYLDEDQKMKYVSQTSYGISMRALAAVISIHGDNIGIIFPPEIAPIQVVIVPIPSKKVDTQQLLQYCEKVYTVLKNDGYRVYLDNSDYTPGEKYYRWERKGVPLRIEIGFKELSENKVTITRRDTRKKITCGLEELSETVKRTLDEIVEDLRSNAEEEFNKSISDAQSLEELKQVLQEKGGLVKVPLCSVDDDGKSCGEVIKAETGADVRGVTFPEPEQAPEGSKCIICGKPAKVVAWVAKSY
ncbi:MAG: proline--tRNA ligase [Candidatus Asgardarchaeia archaeon]